MKNYCSYKDLYVALKSNKTSCVQQTTLYLKKIKKKKSLNAFIEVFEKTAQEISRLQERLSAAYEDSGQGLSKYFDIH